ncbi:MAG: hemerythrin domain-containing protein [Myxococcales bacterium]|nr:hemerythrin domain-containing protein [Myxococcales bacterium]
MRPSAVRERIVEEHARLRQQLDALDSAANRLETEGQAALPEALELSRGFHEALRDHIDLEDAILVPTLREADAWGPERADRLAEHHRQQRAEIRALGEADAAEADPVALADRLRQLCREIREDMKHEESGVLSADLLRDDPVAIDAEGG